MNRTLTKWILSGVLIATTLSEARIINAQPSKETNATNPTTTTSKERTRVFNFDGGTPSEFIGAVHTQLGVNWLEIVTVPSHLDTPSIPKLRVPNPKPEELLKLYNRLSDRNPSIGKWHWEGDIQSPVLLVLLPEKDAAPSTVQKPSTVMKVISLKAIPPQNHDALVQMLANTKEFANRSLPDGDPNKINGHLSVDLRTDVLIASGSQTFIDLVESSIKAYAETLETADGKSAPSSSKPGVKENTDKPDKR